MTARAPRIAQPIRDRFEQASAESAPAALGAHEQLGEKRVGAREFEIESEGADRVPVEAPSIRALRDHHDAQTALPQQAAQAAHHARATKRNPVVPIEVRHQGQQLVEVRQTGRGEALRLESWAFG